MAERKPYRVVGAYDSETATVQRGARFAAYPMLHQIGLIHEDFTLAQITPDNVETVVSVELYRHAAEVYARLDDLADAQLDYVPVICVHNLGFDMWGLSPWLHERAQRGGVDVLAKSSVKPITLTVLDDFGKPALVLWDTFQLTLQGLERMGRDCGYSKASGAWDYERLRAPDTPLTADEVIYATRDIYALVSWLGWWSRRNSWADESQLGRSILTKTGIVRAKITSFLDHLRLHEAPTVGDLFFKNGWGQKPDTDEHLHTMHAATRGGLTFCASRWASVPLAPRGLVVASFDAVSQHPAQMTSHYYPHGFTRWEPRLLDQAFAACTSVTPAELLRHWSRPFQSAFYGAFAFEGLRPKRGSAFERHGIATLADARLGSWADVPIENVSHEGQRSYKIAAEGLGYKDVAKAADTLLGKIVSAERCVLWLTELEAWAMARAYEWDSVSAVSGFGTWRYQRPTDRDLLAVARFYAAKRDYKHFMVDHRAISAERACEIMPADFYAEIMRGEASDDDIKAYYQILKSDLNALFGIAATNEARPDAVMTADGIRWRASAGIVDLPNRPKAWYQYGQRIVGWSRVAQVVAIELCDRHAPGIVNGDTDSVKCVINPSKLPEIERDFERVHGFMLKARAHVMARAERYGLDCDLGDMGLYECEYTVSNFCAAWNKAYVTRSDDGRYNFTLAGIPSCRRGEAEDSLNDSAAWLESEGWDFGEVCDTLLGYNLSIAPSVCKLKGRTRPRWGGEFRGRVTDWQGVEHLVDEPAAMALYPMSKTVGATTKADNARNLENALRNRPSVRYDPRILLHDGKKFDLVGVDNG